MLFSPVSVLYRRSHAFISSKKRAWLERKKLRVTQVHRDLTEKYLVPVSQLQLAATLAPFTIGIALPKVNKVFA